MAKNSMKDVREYWKSLPYFHDSFKSTDEVAKFIKKHAKQKPGTFILRPSSRNPDLLTASIMVQDGSVRHTHIMIDDNSTSPACKYFLVPEKKFDTIQHLVSYYHQNPVINLENVVNVKLLHPICRAGAVSSSSDSLLLFSRSNSLASVASSKKEERPPLPTRPRTRSNGSISGGTLSSAGSFNVSCNDPLSQRPPRPLPAEPGVTYDKCLYSRPRDVGEDISQKLKDALDYSERCECGIPRKLAELPLGWTVHQSKEPNTRGKLFYQSPEEKTFWQLPQIVAEQLTRTHKANLKQIDKNWSLTGMSGN